MMSEIESHALVSGASFQSTRPEFDLSREAPSLIEALALQTPQVVQALEYIRIKIPLPKHAAPSVEGHFYRLPNHNRSFCYSLSQSGSVIDAPALVFKGSEPLLQDFSTMLEWMVQAPLRKSSRVMADHFPLAEGKIPGVLSMSEATREAQIALDVQRKHLQHYGELARLPVPLLIHHISGGQAEKCIEMLRRRLSQSAFDRIEPILQQGIAIYVYYYPAAPIRANFWGDLTVPKLRRFIEETLDETKVITRWMTLLVRMFYLGYLPYSVRNEGLGACMDPGNATIDGGFCDPDSIVPIEMATDEEFFRESAIQCLELFVSTVQMFLGLSEQNTLYPTIEKFACRRYVERLLAESLTSESRPELKLDERLLTLIYPTSPAHVRLCVQRKSRVSSYAHFAKRMSRG